MVFLLRLIEICLLKEGSFSDKIDEIVKFRKISFSFCKQPIVAWERVTYSHFIREIQRGEQLLTEK